MHTLEGCRNPISSSAIAVWMLAFFAVCSSRPVAAEVEFANDVLPILSDKCFQCHGPDKGSRKGNLRLDSEEDAKRVRDDYSVIKPFDAQSSELWARLTTADESLKMPPANTHNALSKDERETIRQWIEQGAEWGQHWTFNRVTRPEVPPGRHPVDFFVDRRLTKEGLTARQRAAKRTLIRRVYLDLTGLPPSPSDVDNFLSDTRPDAWERLVDRLLASPAYGERMAWDWLDAARYADTNGYQGDATRTMWPWRDWVIRAFNSNLGYDKFTEWQLAGDLLPNPTHDQVLATAFNRNHMINGEGGRIPEENRVDYVMDMTETVGAVWLGLTLNCCRCHDHKFDPISQRDYYSLSAFFNQTPISGAGGDPHTKPVLACGTPEDEERLKAARQALHDARLALAKTEQQLWPAVDGASASHPQALRPQPESIREAASTPLDQRTDDQWSALKEQLASQSPEWVAGYESWRSLRDRRRDVKASIPSVMVMADQAEPRKSYVLDRGLYNKPLDEVEASVPGVFPPLPSDVAPNRLALAQWLVSRDHPLTARVTVNRMWQMLFGVGLVKTSEDFGVQSERPSHKDLLDWLAADFMESGWDLKHLLKLIVTSEAYRRSSSDKTGELYNQDPENRLLARGPRFRVPSWMIRDQALKVSGLLSTARGGKPVNVYQPEGIWQEATFGVISHHPDSGDAVYRRSIYVFWRRIIGPTVFFDAAKRQVCEVRLARTNTPMHALAVLNDPTYVEAARVLAQRVLTRHKETPDRMQALSRQVLMRDLTEAETNVMRRSLARARGDFSKDQDRAIRFLSIGQSSRDESLDSVELAAWSSVCLNLLNLDEAITKE